MTSPASSVQSQAITRATSSGSATCTWSATVSYAGATDAALTVVVSTGGHVQGVEAFAVTGLRR